VQSQWETDKKSARESKIQAELTSKIGNMFYGSNYMIKAWIAEGKVALGDDGNITYDGKPFDSALELIKTEHKDSVKVSQVPGTGITGGDKEVPGQKSFVDRVKERIANGE